MAIFGDFLRPRQLRIPGIYYGCPVIGQTVIFLPCVFFLLLIERVQACVLADISRSRYAATATQLVHRLQISEPGAFSDLHSKFALGPRHV